MKKITLLLAGIFVLFASHAQAASKEEVWDLLRRIDTELQHYDQSPQELDRVKHKLEEALSILRNTPILDPNACIDFAYNEYLKDGFSSSIALDKSKNFCNRFHATSMTMPVLSFFFTNLRTDGYSASIALDHSLEIGRNISEDLLGCVQTAFGRYRKDGFGARLSLQKSVTFCTR